MPLLAWQQREGDIMFVGMGAAHLVSNLASNIKARGARRELPTAGRILTGSAVSPRTLP